MTLDEVTSILNRLKLPTALALTPINLESEREKFFNSDTYNPQFKYKKFKNNNSYVFWELSKLEKISNVDEEISNFYIRLVKDKKALDNILNAIGNNHKFTQLSKLYFGMPTAKLFKSSYLILRGNVKKYSFSNEIDGQLLDSDKVRKSLSLTLSELGLSDWKVVDSVNIARNGIKTGTKSKEIYIDKNIKRTSLYLKKTIIHEIGTHVIRSHNGLNSNIHALSKASISSYRDVEEGLALYSEEKFGVMTYDNLKHRALMVFAVYLGENLSFRDLYNLLLGFYSKNEAFNLVYRVKRGLSDTAMSGIYPKDVSYLRGYKKVKSAIEKDPSLYEKLYIGKVDLSMATWLDKGLVSKPKIVPSKELFDSIFQKIQL